MVSVLALSMVDRGFETSSGRDKPKTKKWVFTAPYDKHSALKSKNKDWLAQNQNNVFRFVWDFIVYFLSFHSDFRVHLVFNYYFCRFDTVFCFSFTLVFDIFIVFLVCSSFCRRIVYVCFTFFVTFTYLPMDCCFSELETRQIQQSVVVYYKVEINISSNIDCTCHDIANKLLIWC
jgi:hypothetical protein